MSRRFRDGQFAGLQNHKKIDVVEFAVGALGCSRALSITTGARRSPTNIEIASRVVIRLNVEISPTEIRRVTIFRNEEALVYSLIDRNRSAFAITETELKLIATPAIIGLSTMPKNGYRTPAAIGTPSALYMNAKKRF